MRKIKLTGLPQELEGGLSEAIALLPLELAEDGLPVRIEHGGCLRAELNEDGGRIVWSKPVEIFRALAHLAREDAGCKIEEHASFRTNGLMLDASRNAVPRPEAVKRLIVRMALMGLDILMLYTEDTYEVEGYPYFGYMRGGYSKADIRGMDDYAAQFGIEMMPCIQTLGHHSMILRWMKAMREISDTGDVLLVGEDATYRYLEQIMSDASEPYRSNRIHIGMDESGSLGTGAYRAKHGTRPQIDIFQEHMGHVREIAHRLGLRPMIWSDMYFAFCSPKHDYDPDCELPESVLKLIPDDIELVYWDYYHHEQSFYEGVIEQHRRSGAPLLFAGGMWNWQSPAVNYRYMASTSVPGLRASRDAGIGEVFVTAWGDNGVENSLESLLYGLQMYAEFDYMGDYYPEELDRRFTALHGVDAGVFRDLSLFDMPPHAPEKAELSPNPSFMLLYEDPLTLVFEKDFEGLPLTEHYGRLHALYQTYFERTEGALRPMAESYLRLAEVLHGKCVWRDTAPGIVRRGDREAAWAMAELARSMTDSLRALHGCWYRLWMDDNRPHGWDVHDIRLGAQITRWETAAKRMEAFASGELDTIAEMEREKLRYGNEREWYQILDADGRQWRLGTWRTIATPEHLTW